MIVELTANVEGHRQGDLIEIDKKDMKRLQRWVIVRDDLKPDAEPDETGQIPTLETAEKPVSKKKKTKPKTEAVRDADGNEDHSVREEQE